MSEADPQPDSRSIPSTDDDALQFAVTAARIAGDNRSDEVGVIDVRGLSSIADFIVIGTGTSDRQMRAVLDRIKEHARGAGRAPFRVADTLSSSWVLADYVDVVIHLFGGEQREYYDLDGLWDDAPRIEWSAPAVDAAQTTTRD